MDDAMARILADLYGRGSVSEGYVVKAKAGIMDTINGIAANLNTQAQGYGLDAKTQYLRDIDDRISPAVMTVQLGFAGPFPQSEAMTVEIYDDDNIIVKLPEGVAKHPQVSKDPYVSVSSYEAAYEFLGNLYERVVVMHQQT